MEIELHALVPDPVLPVSAPASTRTHVPRGYGVQEQCLPFTAAASAGLLIKSPISFGFCPPRCRAVWRASVCATLPIPRALAAERFLRPGSSVERLRRKRVQSRTYPVCRSGRTTARAQRRSPGAQLLRSRRPGGAVQAAPPVRASDARRRRQPVHVADQPSRTAADRRRSRRNRLVRPPGQPGGTSADGLVAARGGGGRGGVRSSSCTGRREAPKSQSWRRARRRARHFNAICFAGMSDIPRTAVSTRSSREAVTDGSMRAMMARTTARNRRRDAGKQ